MITSDEAFFLESLHFQLWQPMLLCADVGGTNTRLHLFKVPEPTGREAGSFVRKVPRGIPIPLKEEDREICPEGNYQMCLA